MKLSKNQLKQLIKEELQNVLREQKPFAGAPSEAFREWGAEGCAGAFFYKFEDAVNATKSKTAKITPTFKIMPNGSATLQLQLTVEDPSATGLEGEIDEPGEMGPRDPSIR